MSSNLDLIFSMADGLNPYISDKGVLKCQAFLFGLFASETNEKDRLLVHHYVKNLAEQVGGVEHCYHYALNLYFGIGCPIDCQKCIYWLKKGVDLGDEKSMYRLGVIFKNGEPGIPQNHKEAFYYFGLSSKRGNIKARFKVAMYYIQGREFIPNGLQKGITLLEECAHYGHLKSKTTLGVIFKDFDNLVVGARRGSPLAVGYGHNENFIGSDSYALKSMTNKISYLDDGDLCIISKDKVPHTPI